MLYAITIKVQIPKIFKEYLKGNQNHKSLDALIQYFGITLLKIILKVSLSNFSCRVHRNSKFYCVKSITSLQINCVRNYCVKYLLLQIQENSFCL